MAILKLTQEQVDKVIQMVGMYMPGDVKFAFASRAVTIHVQNIAELPFTDPHLHKEFELVSRELKNSDLLVGITDEIITDIKTIVTNDQYSYVRTYSYSVYGFENTKADEGKASWNIKYVKAINGTGQ